MFCCRPGHLSVMLAIGNTLANSVWEAVTSNREKPTSDSKREQKEQWIRSKYETKEFLPPIPNTSTITQQLAEAILRYATRSSNILTVRTLLRVLSSVLLYDFFRNDMRLIVLLLAYATTQDINAPISQRDLRRPIHVACSISCLPVVQLLLWVSISYSIRYSRWEILLRIFFYRSITPTLKSQTTKEELA